MVDTNLNQYPVSNFCVLINMQDINPDLDPEQLDSESDSDSMTLTWVNLDSFEFGLKTVRFRNN